MALKDLFKKDKEKKSEEWITLPVEVRVRDFEADSNSMDPEGLSKEPVKATTGRSRFRRDWIEYFIATDEDNTCCYLDYMGNTFKVLIGYDEVTKLLGNK